jgi:WD40 repeat protein
LAVTLAYVRACGGNERYWETWWREIAHAPADIPEDNVVEVPAPYVGLAAFQAGDADRFFGRDKLVSELRELVGERRLVGVVGASGSGKSSLLRAGLVSGSDSPAVVFTPGSDPVEQCAVHLSALTGGSAAAWRADLAADPANLHLRIRQAMVRDNADLLLVIDQFEEVITLCSAQDRAWLVDALTRAAGAECSRVRIVLGVRADFYGHSALSPELVDAMHGGHALVGPMTTDELREAITTPAVRCGFQVETALVARIIADAAGQPAVLPLVSHALLETWRRRRGVALTLAGYEAAGGIQHAVARTAEEVYHALEPGQQQAARRLFLRLIAIGEGTEDAKRRIALDELHDDPDTVSVLDRLTEARLVVVDHAHIEIIHEALIRHWPRLRAWLDEDRDGLRIHRHLTDATAGWRALDRDPGSLYRGARLVLAREWAASAPDMLTTRDKEFLDASTAADRDEQQRTRRRNRQLRWLAVALVMLLFVASGIATVAVRQRQEAVAQQRIALSRQLSAQALEIASKDAGKASRWALEAYNAWPTAEARGILLSLASRPSHTARLPRSVSTNYAVAFSPDHRLLATSGGHRSGEVDLWDVTTRTQLTTLPSPSASLLTAAYTDFRFSADGTKLAAACPIGGFVVWDVPRRTILTRFNAPESTNRANVAISPDLRLVAFADRDHTITVYDTTTRQMINHNTQAGGPTSAIAFSPDGQLLAASADDGTTTVWDTTTYSPTTLSDGRGPIPAIAFSPDSSTLATGRSDGTIALWNIPSHTRLADLSGHASLVTGLAFHPRAPILVSTGQDNKVILWDTTRLTRLTQLETNEPTGLNSITISPDGDTIAAPADDATLLWDRTDLPLIGHTTAADNLAFDPHNNHRLFSLGRDGLFSWDTVSHNLVARLSIPTYNSSAFSIGQQLIALNERGEDHESHVTSVWDLQGMPVDRMTGANFSLALSPRAPVLATATTDGSVQVRNIAHKNSRTLSGPSSPPKNLAFTKDGRILVAVGDSIQLWNLDTQKLITELPLQDDSPTVAVSPDDQLLAVGGTDGTARLWDLPTHTPITELTGHTGAINFMTITDDGGLLATAGADKKIILWDLATRTRWATLTGHTNEVTNIATNLDNTHLATSSADNTITIWTINPADAITHLCHRLTHDFPAEKPPPNCSDTAS